MKRFWLTLGFIHLSFTAFADFITDSADGQSVLNGHYQITKMECINGVISDFSKKSSDEILAKRRTVTFLFSDSYITKDEKYMLRLDDGSDTLIQSKYRDRYEILSSDGDTLLFRSVEGMCSRTPKSMICIGGGEYGGIGTEMWATVQTNSDGSIELTADYLPSLYCERPQNSDWRDSSKRTRSKLYLKKVYF